MSYLFVVRDAAVEDAADVYAWYETQTIGLGNRFLMALDELLCVHRG